MLRTPSFPSLRGRTELVRYALQRGWLRAT
jgi:hypothetical protein